MKKKTICFLPLLLAFVFLLASCAQEPASSSTSVGPAPLSELEQNIAHYEQLIIEDPSAENFATLAGYYAEAGKIKKQRNTLELSYLTNNDVAALEALQNIVVNAEEESAAILEDMRLLEQNLSLAEYQGEALAVLLNADWYTQMMPRLQTGSRNYYLKNPDTQSTLLLEVGYDENALPYTSVWLTKDESGETTYLFQSGEGAQLLTTTLTNGSIYNGPFTSWQLLSNTGSVYYEEGNFVNGLVVGDYVANEGGVGETVDLYTLFNTKDTIETLPFTGNFGEDGRTTVEQPQGDNDFIVYAYAEDGVQYLQRNLPEEVPVVVEAADTAEEDTSISEVNRSPLQRTNKSAVDADASLPPEDSSLAMDDTSLAEEADMDAQAEMTFDPDVFTYEFYNMPAYKSFTPYVPAPDAVPSGEVMLDLATVQVRVNDSNIEWFDGTSWHVAGSVEDYIMQDPYYVVPYVMPQTGTETEQGEEGEAGSTSSAFSQRERSQEVVQQTYQPTQQAPATTTTAPATTTTAPAATPAPEPAPAPETPPATGTDGGDIGWTPDLL